MEVHIAVPLVESMEKLVRNNGGDGTSVVTRVRRLSLPEMSLEKWAGKQCVRIWTLLECLKRFRGINFKSSLFDHSIEQLAETLFGMKHAKPLCGVSGSVIRPVNGNDPAR